MEQLYTGNWRPKIKIQFVQVSIEILSRGSKELEKIGLEFTYLCFWNTVTVMGSLRSPPTISMIVSSPRIANKRVDYSEDNWNLIFPRLEIYNPPMIFAWPRNEVVRFFFLLFFFFFLFLDLSSRPELLSFEFLSWAFTRGGGDFSFLPFRLSYFPLTYLINHTHCVFHSRYRNRSSLDLPPVLAFIRSLRTIFSFLLDFSSIFGSKNRERKRDLSDRAILLQPFYPSNFRG